MKHSKHCHCGLDGQIRKLRAGKLGILGGILLIGHLLFHVAECLVLPALLMAFSGKSAEAVSELDEATLQETTFASAELPTINLQISFRESLEQYQLPLRR